MNWSRQQFDIFEWFEAGPEAEEGRPDRLREEQNIRYVAITRAQEELVYVAK